MVHKGFSETSSCSLRYDAPTTMDSSLGGRDSKLSLELGELLLN